MRILLSGLLAAVFSAALADEALFESRAGSAVTVDGGLSRGVAWGDMDGDGDPDLVVANTIGQNDFLYRNDGERFTQLHEIPVTLNTGWTEGIAWVDFDNDGDLDLFTAGGKPNRLFRNDGAGQLELHDAGELTSAQFEMTEGCWADYDNDGLLDVYLATRDHTDDVLFRNAGDGRFERIAGPWDGRQGNARACGWGDADADGDLDIYVGNAYEPDGQGGFRKQRNALYLYEDGGFVAVENHPLVNEREQAYGVSWVDFDHDGDHDLFIGNIGRTDHNRLFENLGGLEFASRDDLVIVYDSIGPSKGHAWGDYDLDGDLDLFVANGTGQPDNRNFLYLGDGAGNFEKARPEAIVQDNHTSAGAAWADPDLDGDLDLFVANWGDSDEDNDFYENQVSGRHWLKLRLLGTRSNSHGIGALVRLMTRGEEGDRVQTRVLLPKTGYASHNEPIVHFGLGDAVRVERLEVHWPSGQVDRFENVVADQFLRAEEGGRGLVMLDAGPR